MEKWNATVLIRYPDESQGPACHGEAGSEAFAGMTNPLTHFSSFVMRGLDPRICRWPEMAGSSPAMTVFSSSFRRKPESSFLG
jgi:hypothetical protein